MLYQTLMTWLIVNELIVLFVLCVLNRKVRT
jgi:hypothetical protein